MTVDQRLHRAAHELRELPIELPAFVAPARAAAGRRLVPTVLTSLLFVVGALAVVTQATTPGSDPPVESSAGSAEPVVAVRQVAAVPTVTLTPREELAIIARLGDSAPREIVTEPEDHRIPPGAS